MASEKIDVKARLVEIQGNQEEFADLLGEEGRLYLSPGNNWFGPEGRGDSLTMDRKRMTRKDDKISVSTRLGNTFTFRVIKGERK